MANSDHRKILQDALDGGDITIWNKRLRGKSLINVDLSFANLLNSDLRNANLRNANLRNANLSYSDLRNADLSFANLSSADLSFANLSSADLNSTNLNSAHLSSVNLSSANLHSSDLSSANLSSADLSFADLQNALFERTTFGDVDLSTVKYLNEVNITGPCTIGIDTLYKSQAVIHDPWFNEFLEKCGVPETMRTFASSLVVKALDYYSCFISYSTQDEEFCQELQSRLKRRGLRVWFAPEEMKGGRKIYDQLYEAIRYHDKLILVLSEASMNSNWVQLEIKRARKREKEEGRQVLFPILLIPYENLQSWELITSDGEDLAEEIRQYFIPDFIDWKNHDMFTKSVDRLVADLIKDE